MMPMTPEERAEEIVLRAQDEMQDEIEDAIRSALDGERDRILAIIDDEATRYSREKDAITLPTSTVIALFVKSVKEKVEERP
jgi:hypothetical protein